MLIRFLLRGIFRTNGLRNLSRVKGRNRFGVDAEDVLDLAPKFDEAQWEEGIDEILGWAEDQAGNAGQETLIIDYLTPKVLDYCDLTQEEFDPEEFVDVMKDELGDDYYYAINLIIDEMALMLDELRDACHQSFLENASFRLGLGVGISAMYLDTPGRMFPNMAAAMASYQAAAIRNGYRPDTSSVNRAFNAEKRRQSLIKKYGPGPIKPWRSEATNLGSGFSAYQAAAARNGYKTPTTAANRSFNAGLRQTSLIKKTGTVPTKAWK